MNTELDSSDALQARRQRQLVLLLIAILYTIAITSRWAVSRDSAFYLTMGRNIAAGEGMLFNGEIYPGFSPGLLLLWAGIVRVFGENYLVGTLIMVAMAIVTIWAGYTIVRELRGRSLAGVALILLVLNPRIFRNAGALVTDLPFMCLVTVTILGLIRFLAGRRGAIYWAAGAFAAAMMFRLVGMVMLPLLMAGILLDSSMKTPLRRRIIGCVVFLAIVLPVLGGWYVYYQSAKTAGDTGYLSTAAGLLDNGLGPRVALFFSNIVHLPTMIIGLMTDQRPAPMFAIPLLLTAAPGIWRSIRRREAVLLIPTAGYMGFLAVWDESAVSSRNLMPVLVPWVMWTLEGADIIARRLLGARAKPAFNSRHVVIILACVIGGTGITRPLYKRLRFFAEPIPWNVRSEREIEHYRLCEWITANTHAEDTVVARERTVIHYWTGRLTHYFDQDSLKSDRQVAGKLVEQADWIVLTKLDKPDDELPAGQDLLAEIMAERPGQFERFATIDGYVIHRRIAPPAGPGP